MDKKSPPKAPRLPAGRDQPRAEKILIWAFVIFIIASVTVTYYRIMIKNDYIIEAQANCDPETEKCFGRECDPESDETCSENLEENITYYKIVNKNFKNIPPCDSQNEDCGNISCAPGEEDCTETLCDETNVPEGESCNDPETYIQENAESEEEAQL